MGQKTAQRQGGGRGDEPFTLHLASVEAFCFSISSSYDPTLLWIPTPLFASSRYNKHWNPPLPYFTLFSALSLHLHPWASPLSPNILPGMEGAEHSTCLDPSRHHRPVDLSWKGWVVEEHGWVWMEGWGGYSCRLKVKVGGWGISALMEKTQRKQEVTPLTHPEACGVTQLTLGQPRVFSFFAMMQLCCFGLSSTSS